MSSSEEVNIIQLLCKTHELEIEKAEVQSNALLQQVLKFNFVLISCHKKNVTLFVTFKHELMRRDILLLKYDRQKTLMDQIIKRQRALIEGEKICLKNDSIRNDLTDSWVSF